MARSKFIITFIPLLLCGCVTESSYRYETVHRQFVPFSQIQKSNFSVKRKHKIIKNNNLQSVHIYNQNPAYSPNYVYYKKPKKYRQSYRTQTYPSHQQTVHSIHSKYRANSPYDNKSRYEPQQTQANLQREEARQFEQARQNSLVTARQEEEARQIKQAKQNSLVTAHQEEEARQMEQARVASLQTYAEEQAGRQ